MSIFSFFKREPEPSCAQQAKERLQIVLAHERVAVESPDYLPQLQKELLSVIAKYVQIDEEKVSVKLDRTGTCSTLEVDVELPREARQAVEQMVKQAAASGAVTAKPVGGAAPQHHHQRNHPQHHGKRRR